MRWLSHPSRQSLHNRLKSGKCRSARPMLEALEDRIVPTQAVFVDFGDNFPLSGGNRTLTTTVGAVRRLF